MWFLPESVYLERYDDLNVELFPEPFVALRQPVVSSPHDQKPTADRTHWPGSWVWEVIFLKNIEYSIQAFSRRFEF
jgi:hypothetical protein